MLAHVAYMEHFLNNSLVYIADDKETLVAKMDKHNALEAKGAEMARSLGIEVDENLPSAYGMVSYSCTVAAACMSEYESCYELKEWSHLGLNGCLALLEEQVSARREKRFTVDDYEEVLDMNKRAYCMMRAINDLGGVWTFDLV